MRARFVASLVTLLALAGSGAVRAAVPVAAASSDDPSPNQDFAIDSPWPATAVYAFAPDRDGALWVGAQTGLSRWDGSSVHLLDLGADRAREGAGQHVFDVAAGPGGSLWLASGGGRGLLSFGAETGPAWWGGLIRGARGLRQVVDASASPPRVRVWGTADGLPDDRVWALAACGSSLWIGTEHGLARWSDGAGASSGARITSFDAGAGLADPRAWALACSRDAGVLVGTPSGLFRVARGAWTRLLNDVPVLAIVEANDGTVFAGTPKGLVALPAGREPPRWYGAADGLPASLDVRALLFDRTGALWVGATTGLWQREGDRFRDRASRPARGGLDDPRVLALGLDAAGDVWVGTRAGGVARFSRRIVRSHGAPEGLPGQTAYAVLGARAGGVWVSAANGVSHFDGARATHFVRGRNLPDVAPGALAENARGDLWIGTEDGRLVARHDGVFHVITPPDPLRRPGVRMLFFDQQDTLWIGWEGSGLGRARVGVSATGDETLSGRLLGAGDGACNASVITATQGRAAKNRLFFGTMGGGFIRMDDDRAECVTSLDGQATDDVAAVLEDADGTLWLGSTHDRGLVRVRGGRALHLTEHDGLACDSIYRIIDDEAGHLWTACGGGVSRIDRADVDAVATWARPMLSPLRFDVWGGMRSQETTFGFFPSADRARAGDVWVATQLGAAVIDAGALTALPPAPAVRVTALRLNGQAIARTGGAAVCAGRCGVEVEWETNPARAGTIYRYALDGAGGAWRGFSRDRRVLLAGVPAGDVRFSIEAGNAFGVWSGHPVDVPLRLQPPFHRRPLFAALVAALLILGAWGTSRLRARRERARVQALRLERERIARDLHDGLGQGFAALGFHLEALDEVLERAHDATQARGMLRRSRETLDNARLWMRKSVWQLRAAELGDVALPEALARLVREMTPLARQTGAQLSLRVVGATPQRAPMIEHELLQIAREALNNALTHGKPGRAWRAWIDLSFAPDAWTLRVSDDGVGLNNAANADAAGGHFGLVGMHERALGLGGNAVIRSRAGGGTEVEITVPPDRGESPA